MAGINIPFLANVRDFLRGTREAGTGVEDLAGDLDDLARDGDRAGDKVGDSLTDAGKEGETAAEKIERSFSEALKGVTADSKRAGDGLGDGMRDGAKRADDALDDVKDEANSTARETAASFDGSAESIVDAFQEVAANAIAPLGPAGAAAGLAIALGMGGAMAVLQGNAERAAELKQNMIDLANEIHDVGGDVDAIDWGQKFRDYGNAIADAKSWFEPWQDAALTNFEVVDRAAREFGIDYATLFQGMAGDPVKAAEALSVLSDKIEEQRGVVDELTEAAGRGNDMRGQSAAAAQEELDSLEGLRDQLQENSGLTEDAIELEELIRDSYENSAAGIAEKNDQLREHAELTSAAVSTELDWLDALEQSTQKLQENSAAGFDKNTAAGRENLRALNDIAQAAINYADAQEEATGDTAAANAAIEAGRVAVLDAGKALGMTEQQALDYARSLGLIPRNVNTTANADTAAAESALNNTARPRSTSMTVQADLTDADRTIRNYRPTITVNATVGVMRAV